jgi:hypothetical protein
MEGTPWLLYSLDCLAYIVAAFTHGGTSLNQTEVKKIDAYSAKSRNPSKPARVFIAASASFVI